jgi:16S rRNA processing protein RimM
VRPDWVDSDSLLSAKQLIAESADGTRRTLKVVRARRTPKGILVLLEGIADRTAAEALKGQHVGVSRAALPRLKEGEYYLCDLVGLDVLGPSGAVGRVVGVEMYPSVDAAVIETDAGELLEQPLLEEWIEEVNVLARRLVLSSLDGLIEVPRGSSADEDAYRDESA